jgi:hypothetical protein
MNIKISNKPTETSTTSTASEEFKEQGARYNLSKFEYDLYHEEDDIVQKIIRVKRTGSNSSEKWKIFQDTKLLFLLDGSKLGNKEKDFLRTVDGVNFLISQAKEGIKSFNALKTQIKKKLTS